MLKLLLLLFFSLFSFYTINKMDEKLLILLGLGTIGYLAATNFNNNDDEEEEEIFDDGLRQNDIFRQNNTYLNQPLYQESYLPAGVSNNSPSISYTNYPNIPVNSNVSPLGFGHMVQENYTDIQEDFVPSDYIQLNEYTDNPYEIPVYNEDTGNVGLPVSDMTDMGADNKYIYDRTLGSIGFTSTKIGGRRRGQADYIRGDLPILPDRGAWFQVSPDVVNTLLDGALGNQQALGSEAPPAPAVENYYEKPKKGMAMRTVAVLDETTGAITKDLGQCDDEKPDYIDCVYDKFKQTGRQPTMDELKRMYALQEQTVNSKYAGYSKGL